MSVSHRLRLPFLLPGQAQKEMTHNEALQILDVLVSACVEGPPMQSPPTSPPVGSTYIVAASPTGAWSAFPHHLAAFTQGGWRFMWPAAGLRVLVKTTGVMAVYRDGVWEIGNVAGSKFEIAGQQVVGARGAVIDDPSAGSVIDSEAREAIVEILNRLRTHGLIA